MSNSIKESPTIFTIFDQDPVNDNIYYVKQNIVDLAILIKLIGGDKFNTLEELKIDLALANLAHDNLFKLLVDQLIIGKRDLIDNFDSFGRSTGGNGFIIASTILLALSELDTHCKGSKVLLNNSELNLIDTTTCADNLVFIQPETKSKLVIRGAGRRSFKFLEFEKMLLRLEEVTTQSSLHISFFPEELSYVNKSQLEKIIDQKLLPILRYYVSDKKRLLTVGYFRSLDHFTPKQLSEFINMARFFILNKEELLRLLDAMNNQNILSKNKLSFTNPNHPLLRNKQINFLTQIFTIHDKFSIWVTDGGNSMNVVSKKYGESQIEINSYMPEPLDDLVKNIVGAGDTFIGYLIFFYSMGLRFADLSERVLKKTNQALVDRNKV